MAKKVKKNNIDKYPYEKYAKYKKRGMGSYSKKEWENLDIFKKEAEYNCTKELYYGLPIFYTFCGLLLVGGIVGGIVYGVWIDDILQGILLALGFPIFIIAGFFGAGKGI